MTTPSKRETPERAQYRKILTGLCCALAGLGLAFAHLPVLGQPPYPISVVRAYDEAEQRHNFDQLLAAYGRNKELPPGYELQALLALSHFPELGDVRIRFIYDDVDIPLSSRPFWASMLRSAKNRTYLVVIDSHRDSGRQALLVKNQPFNAQVGIIGHELAHAVYYLERSFFGIAADALCQLSNECRIAFERATDRRLIEYGLGWQRYDHALFVRGEFAANPEIAANSPGGGGAYMSPLELREIMNSIAAYGVESGSASQTD
ncbi:MAG: hypothetical protein RL120_13855 [Gammaproteobacteria bacterium]